MASMGEHLRGVVASLVVVTRISSVEVMASISSIKQVGQHVIEHESNR